MVSEHGAHAQPRRFRKTRVLTLVCLLAIVMAAVWEGMALFREAVQRRLDRQFDRALTMHPSLLPILARRGADLVHPPERGRYALLLASDSSQAALYLARGARLHGLEDAAWLPRSEAPLDLVEVPEELGHVLQAMPVALRTAAYWETLGETEYWVGHYGRSVQSFDTALRAGRANPEAERGLRLARECARAAAAIRQADPSQPAYLLMRQLPGGEHRHWVSLSGTPDGTQAPRFSVGQLRVALWSEGQPWRKLWQSAPLQDPRFAATSYDVARLFAADLNADGVPEIVVVARVHGASWDPTSLFMFKAEGNRLVPLLTADADEVLFIAPDDRGGRYTVSGDHAIGSELSHALQPRWTDYYAWRDGRWRLANADFPGRFDELDQQIQHALKDHPSDPELLIGAARIARYRRHPGEARRLLQDALGGLHRSEIDDVWWRTRARELGRVIRAELRGLPTAPAAQ